MSTLDPDDAAPARERGEYPRAPRFTQEVRLPLAVRKELLLTRAALERHDCRQALHAVRGGVHRLGTISAWLPRIARPGSWMKVVGLTKDYPLLSTAVTLALPLVKRVPVLRLTWKLSKLGLVAGAAYWAYNTWREAKGQAVPPANVPTPAPAGTPPAADTGFRDPLIP
ncbi:DUF3318 domain-containing protein [Cupriavidus neocaledonicus]|uniref:DUF3318 domain-containing protein n=1 Tax=Cupriavidus neocaledonicus TaxID=1040979 RepID=A0A375H9U7_9BURK|nr:DUF3318 domain-containing protein [Cupriavidus neocaledonicus]SOZ35700.1 conserved hypothetical protein [Cupriavidus neocaledonicus]SPD47666.1 conserved protein of unknown function [Cupriavidus neocaledonicus]